MAKYAALPTDDKKDGVFLSKTLSIEDIQTWGPITKGDSRYREDIDFDNDGEIDEFELFMAEILDHAREGRKVDLTDDVWGCAIYTTVNDLPAIMSCDMTFENALRFGYISIVAIVNLCVQFGLLYWISLYVMAPSMRQTQNIYHEFHRAVFSQDGSFVPSEFVNFAEAESLCQFPLFDKWFTFCVLFLWVSECFKEIRHAQRIFSGLTALPSLPWGISHKLMIHKGLHETDTNERFRRIENVLARLDERAVGDTALLSESMLRLYELLSEKYSETQEHRYLVCLTPITRISIFVLVLVPRMVIIVSLMTMGCVWLTATDRFDSLILNALALGFVVNVDNLLYSMFFPVSLQGHVESFKVAVPEAQLDGDKFHNARSGHVSSTSLGSGDDKSEIAGYYRSFFYLAMVTVFVVIFQAFQPVIPGFGQDLEQACQAYIDTWSSPRYGLPELSKITACIMGTDTCFPYGQAGYQPAGEL